jgi:hypothetical protein
VRPRQPSPGPLLLAVAGAWALATTSVIPALVKTRERSCWSGSRNLRAVALAATFYSDEGRWWPRPPVVEIETPPPDRFAREKKLLALAGAVALAGAAIVGAGACAS